MGVTLLLDVDNEEISIHEIKSRLLEKLNTPDHLKEGESPFQHGDLTVVFCGKTSNSDQETLKQLAVNAGQKSISDAATLHLIVKRKPHTVEASASPQVSHPTTATSIIAPRADYPYGQHFPVEFRQYLSSTTQPQRHELGHISTEEYWNRLDVRGRDELINNYNTTHKASQISAPSFTPTS